MHEVSDSQAACMQTPVGNTLQNMQVTADSEDMQPLVRERSEYQLRSMFLVEEQAGLVLDALSG